MASSYIRFNILRIIPENLQNTIKFYTGICGMRYSEETVDTENYPYTWNDDKLHIFSYDKRPGGYESTALCFLLDDNHQSTYKNSGYWKIGISLRDVNAAVGCFNRHGNQVQPGEQFFDVGFLTSLSDPNGYSIELLQHDFDHNYIKPANTEGILSQPIEIPPSIGQITIRCTNVKKTRAFYENTLGMKLMCVEQPDNRFPFTLYFFAFTSDDPPSENLSDLANREWLYKKDYCQLEIQHRHNLPNGFSYYTNDNNNGNMKLGHVGFCVCVTSHIFDAIHAKEKEINVSHNALGNKFCFIHDPDGYVIQVVCV